MSRPMSAFVPGQVISITIDDTTLNVMVRSVEIAGGPGRPYQPERVADTSTGGQPLEQIIERSRVDALERRADTRDTAFAKLEAAVTDVFRQLAGVRLRAKAEELEGRERDRRLDSLETARAWIDTASVKDRLDTHATRLSAIEVVLERPLLPFNPHLKP